MANKLYEEESIRAIADAIRQSAPGLAGNRTFKVEEMADAINHEVCDERYDLGERTGLELGVIQGVAKVKTEEARTSSDVTHSVTKIAATVTIPSGYYAEEVKRVLDVQDGDLDPIVDAAYDEGSEAGYNNGYDTGHTEGYNEGYEAGLAQGGGGGGSDPEIDELLLVDDVDYDDEGEQFYSVYKWVDVNHSSFSSQPVVYTIMNNHPTKWLKVYIIVDQLIDGYPSISNYSLRIAPDQGEDSIEINDGYSVRNIYIEGVRFD